MPEYSQDKINEKRHEFQELLDSSKPRWWSFRRERDGNSTEYRELSLDNLVELGYDREASQLVNAVREIEQRIKSDRQNPSVDPENTYETWLRKVAQQYPHYGFKITDNGKFILTPASPEESTGGDQLSHYGILTGVHDGTEIDQLATLSTQRIWGNSQGPTYLEPNGGYGVAKYGGSARNAVWVKLDIDTSILMGSRQIFHDPEMLTPKVFSDQLSRDRPGGSYWVHGGIPIQAIKSFS